MITEKETFSNDTDGIVIQARSGSTRMPSKILLPFNGEERIIDIVIENIKKSCPGKRVVLATTVNPADDILESIASEHGVDCFRGSEEDVLSRFLGAAEKFGLRRILRVCSDNPFLLTDSFPAMFRKQEETGADYTAYAFPDGRPTIKSHIGLFAELATVDALRSAMRLTEDDTDRKLYREHVTIYLYTHPSLFDISFMELPEILKKRTDLRLTLDTPSDFALLSELYRKLHQDADTSPEALIRLIDSNPKYGRIMKENIANNEK